MSGAMMAGAARRRSAMPGLGLTLGITLSVLALVVMLPLAALLAQAAGTGWGAGWALLTSPRALAAFRVSFGAAALAALANVPVGVLLAWVLTRYRVPGQAGAGCAGGPVLRVADGGGGYCADDAVWR